MAQISIGDLTGSAQIDISDDSLAVKNQLSQLETAASGLLAALPKPITDPTFKDATFAANFEKPSIALKGNTIDAKASVNSTLTVCRSSDTPLFGADDYDPITITGDECWISFELDTVLDTSVAVPLPQGFGVSFEGSTAPGFATYVHIPAALAPTTSLSQAIARTLNAFKILDSSDAVLAIPQDVIYTSDLVGTVKFGGSWALPLSANQLSLADAKLPFNASTSVAPALTLKAAGDISLTSEFNVRIRRTAANLLYLGVYEKKGATLEVSFAAAAGLGANAGNSDLISEFFQAFGPGIDTSNLASSAAAADIQQVLEDSIDRSLSVSVNAACSAANSNEAVFAYAVDISTINQSTKDAIDGALHGDWTPIAKLPNARELRNVVTRTLETKFCLTVNLLGIYNYRSVADFVKSMQVVKNDDEGSITITDSATASWIATAATPLAVADRLRSALYEGFVATATYKALLAGIGADPVFGATQGFLIYKNSLGYRDALKQLNAGEVLGVMPPAVKTNLPAFGNPVHHALFGGSRTYTNDDVLRFFFSDIKSFAPRSSMALKQIGRQVLARLLDAHDPTDQKRISALQSDHAWAAMDANPAQILPAYYPDWYDITMWAEALAKTAPLLADIIGFAKTVVGDPTANPTFMKKRGALALALDGVTHKTSAAFDKAFPMCVMSTLAGNLQGAQASPPVFEATWNSSNIFSNQAAPKVAAA